MRIEWNGAGDMVRANAHEHITYSEQPLCPPQCLRDHSIIAPGTTHESYTSECHIKLLAL